MKKSKPQISIMIPVYNEEKTLTSILERVLTLPIGSYEVIIVDDASRDSSPEIISKFVNMVLPSNISIKALRHSENKGKGAGIQTALEHASGHYFVIQDADLEYDPVDIPRLHEHALENNFRVVYGSRFMGDLKNMPKPNYLANRFYNQLVNAMYGTSITDMHTCYKLVRTDILKSFNITSNGFDYAPELVSNILRRGMTIHELPISFDGRTKNEGKKINFKDGVDCIYKLIKYRLKPVQEPA